MNKKVILVLALLFCVMLFFVLFGRTSKQEILQDKIELMLPKLQLTKRYVKKTNNRLYIGNNEKEIDNGFWDILIELQENNGYKLYLNKLWYEKCDEDYIDEEYLAQFLREFVQKTNFINSEQEEIQYFMYKYIKDNYVESVDNRDYIASDFENIRLQAKIEENVFVLYLNFK